MFYHNSVENFKSQSKLPKTLQCLKSFDAVILTMRKDKDKKKKKEKEKKARLFSDLNFSTIFELYLYYIYLLWLALHIKREQQR